MSVLTYDHIEFRQTEFIESWIGRTSALKQFGRKPLEGECFGLSVYVVIFLHKNRKLMPSVDTSKLIGNLLDKLIAPPTSDPEMFSFRYQNSTRVAKIFKFQRSLEKDMKSDGFISERKAIRDALPADTRRVLNGKYVDLPSSPGEPTPIRHESVAINILLAHRSEMLSEFALTILRKHVALSPYAQTFSVRIHAGSFAASFSRVLKHFCEMCAHLSPPSDGSAVGLAGMLSVSSGDFMNQYGHSMALYATRYTTVNGRPFLDVVFFEPNTGFFTIKVPAGAPVSASDISDIAEEIFRVIYKTADVMEMFDRDDGGIGISIYG